MTTRARLLLAALALLAPLALVPVLPARAGGDWPWPVAGEVITTYRNGDDPYAGGQHRGIDIAAKPGTPVVAAAPGTVRHAGIAGSSGLTISVRTADGRYDTSYLHLSEAAVREGEQIEAGQRLGSSGVTGRRSTEAPHLHFGVREAGSRHAYVDPLDMLGPPPGAPREAPRPVPVPVPVPVREPVRVAPQPQPVPAPVRAPVPRPVRAPAPAPRPVGAPRPRAVPVARGLPGARRAPAPATRGVAVPAGAPAPAAAGASAPAGVPEPRPSARLGRLPELGPAPAGRSAAAAHGRDAPAQPAAPRPESPARAPAGAARPDAAGTPSRGPDLGWALACAGLLLAAACLGRPGDGDRRRQGGRVRERAGTADRGRAALRALMRPLSGRR